MYLVVEVIGGLFTGSLALLADAGHMLTDVGGLGLTLLAIRFAERPATPERTFYEDSVVKPLWFILVFISG